MFSLLTRHLVGLSLGLLLTGASLTAQSQEPATSLDQLKMRLKPGDTVIVTDLSGRQFSGSVIELSASTLELLLAGMKHSARESDLQSIRQRRPDSLKNGAQWGGLIGAGIGAAIYALFSAGPYYDGEFGSPLLMPAFFGGIGVGVGVAVDALIVRQEVIFAQSVKPSASITLSPMVTRQRQGVRVSMQF